LTNPQTLTIMIITLKIMTVLVYTLDMARSIYGQPQIVGYE